MIINASIGKEFSSQDRLSMHFKNMVDIRNGKELLQNM